MVSRRYIVRGRVQGVGFRWFVEREARALGMTGWVRNNEDNSVELVAAGDEAAHTELRSRLEAGPRAARVDRVEESEVTAADSVADSKEFLIQGGW